MRPSWPVWPAAALAVLLAACAGGDGLPSPVSTSSAVPTSAAVATTGGGAVSTTAPTSLCEGFSTAVPIGVVGTPEVTEASGLVTSRTDSLVLWVQNDSGPAVVFGLDPSGGVLATARLTDVKVRDWEDLAISGGPDLPAAYLYVGDVGDNRNRREVLTVWRFPEPSLKDVPTGAEVEVAPERLDVVYPDGPHDAETLLVDGATGSLYIVTKELSGRSGVYRFDWSADQPVTARLVTTIDLGLGGLATGGDVSADGGTIAIRTYRDVWLWNRVPGSSIEEALAAAPCRGPAAAEPQGEAIGFAPDGTGYYTVSEGVEQPLYLVEGE